MNPLVFQAARLRPRPVIIASTLALMLVSSLSTVASAATTITASARTTGESQALVILNQLRSDAGLRALRLDARVATVARDRSDDMAANDYLAHDGLDGTTAADMLDQDKVAWYRTGEIIARTEAPTLAVAAAQAMDMFMSSRAHKAIVLSAHYNYVGIGVAPVGAKTIWTIEFIHGPDRTRPKGVLTKASSASGSHAVKLAWSGSDPVLATLTAGIANYDVSSRAKGGTWSTIRSRTTSRSMTVSYAKGTVRQFRIRTRDRAGNVGDWTAVVTVTVR